MSEKYLPLSVEYINPFLMATTTVFRTMLFTEIQRGELYLKNCCKLDYEISGVIGMSGKAVGTVVVSLSRNAALGAASVLLGERKDVIDAEVIDAIGELTNMIAGSAKVKLESLAMNVSLPNVIIGKNHVIAFPTGVKPIGIPFDSIWGPVAVEVGLSERQVPATVH